MADLNNDGQMDLVLPGNGTVVYWLSLGNGSLTEPIVIPNAPAFNAQDTAVRLADIDGDGATELLYSVTAGWSMWTSRPALSPSSCAAWTTDWGVPSTLPTSHPWTITLPTWMHSSPWEINLPFPVKVVTK
ncbi:VCBS repeat-containing protein [Chloroflexi bacterium TSY]|nr:VCBS repeat-containing protein [Chloroflexi bacterium TSY]